MEFAGDVTRSDIKEALISEFDDEAIETLDHYNCDIEVDILDDFTPKLTFVSGVDGFSVDFVTIELVDDDDVVVGFTFDAYITTEGSTEDDLTAAEMKFNAWYYLATAIELIGQTKFHPYEYFD